MKKNITVFALIGLLFFLLLSSRKTPINSDWRGYNGGDDCNHYSSLVQIDTTNVSQLKLAWTYASSGADTVNNATQIQCNPLIINGIMYGVSAGSQAFAVDATTGKELWQTHLADKTFNMTSRVLLIGRTEKRRGFFSVLGHLCMPLMLKRASRLPLLENKEKLTSLTASNARVRMNM